MSVAIVAFGAVSGLGEGEEAVSCGVVGEPARVCLQDDDELRAAGLARPFAARAVPGRGAAPGASEDRASWLLVQAALACARRLDVVIRGWRSLRVGLALGTSSGGMRSAERLFTAYLKSEEPAPSRLLLASGFYSSPLLPLVDALEVRFEPATLVLGACASSTLAIGLATRWLAEGACDLVLAGGFDAVATFVASGFEVLRATTATLPPRPFRVGRDGMALGEGAAVLALVPAARAPDARLFVNGFGASSDAVHITAPDREGAGLARAAAAALAEAGGPVPDLVSPHGTATPFSDAAESRALARLFGPLARQVVVHPFKAQIGHTLGASGALELLAAGDALLRGVYPAAAGEGELDPDAPAHLLAVTRAGAPAVALKLSAAFGGANAAAVVSRVVSSAVPAPGRPVYVGLATHVAAPPQPAPLASRIGWPLEKVLRADALARLTLAAVASLVERDGSLEGAGIVVGSPFATMETNASFHARILEKGARMAEPRKFPYTSPNASAGDASVAFALSGPSFAVGSGLHAGLEALVAAACLVRAGDADRVVVVAVDEVGPFVSQLAERLGVDVKAGAVALLVSSSPIGAVARVESASTGLGRAVERPATVCGHLALLPLCAPADPSLASPSGRVLTCGSPDLRVERGDPGVSAWARVTLGPVA